MLIIVAIMYIQQTNSRGKYRCYLLLENYREGGKVKHRTIANFSKCSDEEIATLKLALRQVIARSIDQGSRLSAVRLADRALIPLW